MRIEISLPSRAVHGDTREFYADFHRSVAIPCGVEEPEVSFRRVNTQSGTVSLLCDLNSTNAIGAALKMGEMIRKPLNNEDAKTNRLSVYQQAVFRIWVKQQKKTSMIQRKSESHALVSETFREILLEPLTELGLDRETEVSLLVDSCVFELSTEKPEPIIILPEKCKLECVVFPVQLISNKLCMETGCQTQNVRAATSESFSQLSEEISGATNRGLVDVSAQSATTHLKPELKDSAESPTSIRPIRKQGRNLWDDDG